MDADGIDVQVLSQHRALDPETSADVAVDFSPPVNTGLRR